MCGRKKLPFAGYSVVKDHPGKKSLGSFRSPRACSPGPLRLASLAGPFRPAPCRSPELSILWSADSIFQAEPSANAGGVLRYQCFGELGPLGIPGEPRMPEAFANEQSGEYRARTGDLLVANQALSQLS